MRKISENQRNLQNQLQTKNNFMQIGQVRKDLHFTTTWFNIHFMICSYEHFMAM